MNSMGRSHEYEANLSKLPSDLYYDIIKVDGYTACMADNIPYIVGKYRQNELSVETVKCNDSKLLLSLLTLKEKLPEDLFKNPTGWCCGWVKIPDKAVEIVLKWCEKNGYPFEVPQTPRHNSRPFFDLPECQLRFPVTEFLLRLIEIYGAFCLYMKMNKKQVESPGNVNIPVSTGKGRPQFISLKKLIPREDAKEQYAKLFESKFQNTKFISQISVVETPHIKVKALSLFDAAFYELAMNLNNPVPGVDYKVCPLCKSWFHPEHLRQKYCHSPCYPQLAYKRKLREKREQEKEQNCPDKGNTAKSD